MTFEHGFGVGMAGAGGPFEPLPGGGEVLFDDVTIGEVAASCTS